jgi:hypothetical protein
MLQQPLDEPPHESRGVFTGCLFSVGLILAILAIWGVYRWLF